MRVGMFTRYAFKIQQMYTVSHGYIRALTETFEYSKNRPIIPSIACPAQFIAWHRVVFGWPSVLATSFN